MAVVFLWGNFSFKKLNFDLVLRSFGHHDQNPKTGGTFLTSSLMASGTEENRVPSVAIELAFITFE